MNRKAIGVLVCAAGMIVGILGVRMVCGRALAPDDFTGLKPDRLAWIAGEGFLLTVTGAAVALSVHPDEE